jgi:hypothetical protein
MTPTWVRVPALMFASELSVFIGTLHHNGVRRIMMVFVKHIPGKAGDWIKQYFPEWGAILARFTQE